MDAVEKVLFHSLSKDAEETRIKRNIESTVGASDLVCVLRTAYGLMNPPEYDLSKLIVLKKGNVAEKILEDTFKSLGIEPECQRTYHGEKGTIFEHMRVHPDFVIYLDKVKKTGQSDIDDEIEKMKKDGKKIWLIEMKTTGYLPDEPHEYWRLQVMVQAGLISIEHEIKPEEIEMNLFAVNLNNGERRIFKFFWDENAYYEGLERSLVIQTFKEEYIEIAAGKRKEFSVPVEELPATYNAGVCSVCEYTDKCKIFKGQEYFNMDEQLENTILKYIKVRDEFKNIKSNFEEDVKKIFEQIGKNGKGKKVDIRYSPPKKVPFLKKDRIPPEVIEELAKEHPEIMKPDFDALKSIDYDKYKKLLESFGGEKKVGQRLTIRKK